MKSQITQVRENVFTNSKSKQKWSFSKSRRFVQPNANNVGYYSNPTSLEKRSASFGVGKRIQLADTTKQSIDPGAYNIPSTFENKKGGFSFGSGRNQTKFQNYLKMLGTSSTNAFYTVENSTLHKGKAFSIKQRTQYPPNYFLPNDPETSRRSKLPGPASYQTIDALGQKCVSSTKKNIAYHFSNAKRFNNMKTYDMGPGTYEDKTITADGEYILSNMKSSGRRTIFKGKRKSIFDKNETFPGPGQYDVVGDFGQVLAKQTIDLSSFHQSKSKRPQTARQ